MDEQTLLVKVKNTLDSGGVTRYHNAPSVPAQSVGEHSHAVAVIVLYTTMNVYKCAPSLIIAALLHDSEEIITGDIPAPTKWGYPKLEDALRDVEKAAQDQVFSSCYNNDEELKAIVKLADTLDGLRWCYEKEHHHGPVFDRWIGGFKRRFSQAKEAGVLPTTMRRFNTLFQEFGGENLLGDEPDSSYTNQG